MEHQKTIPQRSKRSNPSNKTRTGNPNAKGANPQQTHSKFVGRRAGLNFTKDNRQIRNESITRRLNANDNPAWRRFELMAQLSKKTTINQEQQESLTKATILSHLLMDGFDVAQSMSKKKYRDFVDSYKGKEAEEIKQDIQKLMCNLSS